MRYTAISTKFGWVVVGGSEQGVSYVSLPRLSLEAGVGGAGDSVQMADEEQSVIGDLPLRLQRYFEGEPVAFPDKLEFGGATVFNQTVWNVTRSIPYGETRSYAWVANQIGKPRAFRAVGQAMARNPFPIVVPCHRVVASNGSLCGFGGGLEMKRRLLELEGITRYQF